MYAILTWILCLPFVGALCVILFGAKGGKYPHYVALFFALVICVLLSVVLGAVVMQEKDTATFLLVEKLPWIRFALTPKHTLLITYFLAVDGISAPLLLLSSLVSLVGIVASWQVKKQAKMYFFWYLLLNGCVMGVFMSLDFFLFFLFFEALLIPTYFLIGIWGGEKRETAALRFFLYTLAGSLLIIVVMIALCFGFPSPNLNQPDTYLHTLDIPLLAKAIAQDLSFTTLPISWWGWTKPLSWVLCALLFVGFGIKLAIVPFHTWLPTAHVEAPTAISLLLSGVLLKVGGYGIIRIGYGLFPHEAASFSLTMAVLGVLGILYGGLNALSQHDLKKMIAYSSLAHMGFVLIGLATGTSQGFAGAIYQMVSHGVLSPALFLLAGGIETRFGSRIITHYSGLVSRMPRYTIATAFFFFATLGTPGFSTFIAEVNVLMGAFSAHLQEHMPLWVIVCMLLGILLTAAYLLWCFQRIFFGTYWIKGHKKAPKDLTTAEYLTLLPLAVATLFLGIFPQALLDIIHPALLKWCPFLIR